MGVSLYIARRYLFSKKSKNAINYITGVSVVLVAFVTMSLIIAMSVFNGLTILITSLFNTFDPDIRITSNTGRVFSVDSAYVYLNNNPDILAYTPVLEEDVLFVYAEKQLVGKIKGVGDSYKKTCNVDSILTTGEFVLKQYGVDYVIVGQGVAHNLAVGLMFKDVLQIYAPEREKTVSINPMEDFNKVYAYPRGVFSVQIDIDDRYVISSIELARKLCEYKNNEVSSIEIKCSKNTDLEEIANALQQKLGKKYVVKDRKKQHEFLYKITQSEKLITFLIVTLILIIASFSIVGALTMLIIDKKRDIDILSSMGAGRKLIKRIFIFEGWMISLVGAIIGIIIGVGLSYIQQEFGLLKLQGGSDNFLVDAYPVKVQILDIFYVLGMVLTVGFFAAYLPVNYIIKKHLQ